MQNRLKHQNLSIQSSSDEINFIKQKSKTSEIHISI